MAFGEWTKPRDEQENNKKIDKVGLLSNVSLIRTNFNQNEYLYIIMKQTSHSTHQKHNVKGFAVTLQRLINLIIPAWFMWQLVSYWFFVNDCEARDR